MKSRAENIMQQVDQLATYSAMQGGIMRQCFSREHKQAHRRIALWMEEAGLQVWEDSVGNQWGRKVSRNPLLPTLIIGSHSDTVVDAGKYDGNLGVLLSIEALSGLAGQELPFHVDVVAFTGEEGTRFNATLIGSSATAGCFQQEWLEMTDGQGTTMSQAMLAYGLEPDVAGSDKRLAEETLAYLEVHIEQGPVLENKSLPVGVVTGISGAKRYQFKLCGVAGHAGTVPLELRHDALCGAAEMISTIERFAREHDVVATVGKCDVCSGAVNVIPGEVRFTLDIRSQNQSTLDDCCAELLTLLGDIAQRRQLELQTRETYQAQAVPCSAALQKQWARVVEQRTGEKACLLPSGAGHDAMVMANLTDIGMLFVRCDKGISHNPRELILETDVQVALNCLIDMVQLVGEDEGRLKDGLNQASAAL